MTAATAKCLHWINTCNYTVQRQSTNVTQVVFGAQAKWGELQDPNQICKIEVESALTGTKTLPQQPFSSLQHLQSDNWLDKRSNKQYGVSTLKGVEMRDPVFPPGP